MRYGIFFQLPVQAEQTSSARYRETVEQIVMAEKLGFESAWLAESHFHPRFSALSSPLVFLASVAARTTRIRLGTAGILLPLHHPLRVAEDGAALDVISEGRLELGVGRGSFMIQFQGLGVPMSEADARFEEALEVLRQAWTSGRVSFRGKHFRLGDVVLTPRPVQPGGPPIRITANSYASTEWAASRGYPLMTSSVSHPFPESFVEQMRWYRDAYVPPRDGALPQISMSIPLFVGKTRAHARSLCENSLRSYGQSVGMDGSFESFRRQMGFYGDAQEVTDRALSVVHLPHAVDLIGWFNVGGLVPHEEVMASMERFAFEVRPVLDAAVASRTAGTAP